MAESLLHVRDRTGERTLKLPEDTILRILATARDSTDSLEELLKEAARLDRTVSPALAEDARADIDRPNAPYRIDVVDRVIAFPADSANFAPRGVFPLRKGDGTLSKKDHATYTIGHGWRLEDSDSNHRVDHKYAIRSEKALWADALPPNADEASGYRIDGVDFDASNLRDVYSWTLSNDERAPEVNGKSVYEIRIEGPQHGTVMGQTHDEGGRHKGKGRPGGG